MIIEKKRRDAKPRISSHLLTNKKLTISSLRFKTRKV